MNQRALSLNNLHNLKRDERRLLLSDVRMKAYIAANSHNHSKLNETNLSIASNSFLDQTNGHLDSIKQRQREYEETISTPQSVRRAIPRKRNVKDDSRIQKIYERQRKYEFHLQDESVESSPARDEPVVIRDPVLQKSIDKLYQQQHDYEELKNNLDHFTDDNVTPSSNCKTMTTETGQIVPCFEYDVWRDMKHPFNLSLVKVDGSSNNILICFDRV